IAAAIGDLKDKNPDIVFLSVGGWRVPAFLKELEKAGITAPLFVTGRLEDIFRSPGVSYPGDVYQIARDELPNLYNNRVRQLLFRDRPETWAFNGERNQDAFERIENGCEERPAKAVLDVLSRSNLRAIGIALEFRDMIAMIADVLKSAKPAVNPDDVVALRKTITSGILASFASGKGIFKGSLEDWSFRPSSRTAVSTPFIVARPKDLNGQQLAAIQYVPLKGEKLRKIPTVYLEIDPIRIYRIDDTEKSFGADFYLSMSDENDPHVDMIEFANAFLDYKTNSRQLTIQPLHEGGESDTYPSNMKIYVVSGKFMLDPDYKSYPFDVQRFTIELRPKRGEFPFIVQPLRQDLRAKAFDAEGWDNKDAYVSYDQDFIPISDTKKLEPSVIPFYKSSFVWILKRNATDYYLRVVVPLFFIAIVAYLAIFISSAYFDSIVAIQVTAFLSAVALYITTPKIDSDTATLSDRTFLFNYMVFSLMIVISILRVNKFIASTLHLRRALAIVHVVLIPISVALMAFYVYGAGGSDSHSELEFGPALRGGVSR
ncbi:MAG: amino acid ABC transporter substrate-binding protein, partial [Minisyncoccia bacterium]